MLHLARALVLLLVASTSLVAATPRRRSLYVYCIDLKRSMAANREVYTNAEVALTEAQKQLRSILNLGADSRYKLAKAWEAVVHDEQCQSYSGEYVSVIAECNPASGGEMRTLYDATLKYAKKCLTAEFWDEQMRTKLGEEEEEDKTGLSRFMSKEFLDQYREDNAGERKLHFNTITGENCCQADQSHGALLKVLEPITQAELGQSAVSIIRSDRPQLEQILKRHLFKPCEHYLSSVGSLMSQVKDASEFSGRGKEAFIKSLSQDFQDAIFRYKYCECFRHLSSKEKLNKIDVERFFHDPEEIDSDED